MNEPGFKEYQHIEANESVKVISKSPDSQRNLKAAIIHMQLNITQLKKQLASMSSVTEMMHEMEFSFTTEIFQLCEHYQSVIYDLQKNKQKLQRTIEQVRQNMDIQKNKMGFEIDKRDQLISKLLEKINILEECNRYKQKDKYMHMIQEINSLKINNEELLRIIQRYKKHISQLEDKRKSLEYREKEGFVSLQKRNRFLLDRYLKQKRENESLKSHVESLSRRGSPEKQSKINIYGSPTTHKKNPQTFRTQEGSPTSHYHHKSISRESQRDVKPNRNKNYNPEVKRTQSKQRPLISQNHTPTSQKHNSNQRHFKPSNISNFLSSVRPF